MGQPTLRNMCTFRSDQEIMVCDIAIERVRARLQEAAQRAQFTTVHGQGTLVRANGGDTARFEDVVRAAIQIANQED